jgi:hypothetical protein
VDCYSLTTAPETILRPVNTRVNKPENDDAAILDGVDGRHRISVQTFPTSLRPMARAAPRDRSMSRPRVKGPRSVIVTIVEAPERGLVTFSLVPKGNLLCAALRPSGRKVWPLAVC